MLLRFTDLTPSAPWAPGELRGCCHEAALSFRNRNSKIIYHREQPPGNCRQKHPGFSHRIRFCLMKWPPSPPLAKDRAHQTPTCRITTPLQLACQGPEPLGTRGGPRALSRLLAGQTPGEITPDAYVSPRCEPGVGADGPPSPKDRPSAASCGTRLDWDSAEGEVGF